MNPSDEIERLIKENRYKADSETHNRIINNVLEEMDKTQKQTTGKAKPDIWRIIMNNDKIKIASAAVFILAVILSVTIIDRLTTPAWAIEQTVKALKDIPGIEISGIYNYKAAPIPFTFWIRFSETDNGLFNMRFESEKQITLVKGTEAWVYLPEENTVNIYEDVTTSFGMMRDLGFWYQLAKESPFISGKLLLSLKGFADNWQETYAPDEQTGRDSVFVTCTFDKLSISLWFVCDIETKLIQEAKYWNWSNSGTHEPPAIHATSFNYDNRITDDIFEFQIPQGVEVIYRPNEQNGQNPAQILIDEAENLFHEEKKYAEALDLYEQVYQKYPDLNNGTHAAHALMMIGICHGWLRQQDKAIEVFLKGIEEYSYLEGIEVTYFYLGCAYMDIGQKEQAIEAFENCLKLGNEDGDPDNFPLKNARQGIQELQNQQ